MTEAAIAVLVLLLASCDPIELAPGRTVEVRWSDGTTETQTTPPSPARGLEPEESDGYIPWRDSVGGYRIGGLHVPPEVGAKRITYRYWPDGQCERLTEVWDGDSWEVEERLAGRWRYG